MISLSKIQNERILLSAAILLQACFFIEAISQCRMTIGHDTFDYFSNQYCFLNSEVFSNHTPLWMPFMTQGTIAGWWYGLQAGLLVNALSLFAPLLKGINFIHIFLVGFWIDELVLLIGCWLWAKIFFRNILSVFFFTMTVVVTSVWWTQSWYNFHLYYALPLTFYFIHRFIDTSLIKYGVILVFLLVVQLLGNLPYFLPMITWMLALYFLIWLVFNSSYVEGLLKLRWKWVYIGLVGLFLCSIYYYAVTYGTDQIVNYNVGREQDRTTGLNGFLHYGGGFSIGKWAELILGVSPDLDYTLYGGMLIVPIILSGLAFLFNRRIVPILIFTVVLFDFSMGGISAHIFYYAWPFMKYYRHLGLLAPILKVLICFLAAFILDQMLLESGEGRKRWLLTTFFLILIAFIVYFKMPGIIGSLVPEQWPEVIIFQRLLKSSLANRIEIIIGITLLLATLTFILSWNNKQKIFNLALAGLIMVHLFDIISYKIHETQLRSISVTPFLSQLNFEPMPFKEHRELAVSNGNRLDLIRSLPMWNGVQYWFNDEFSFMDEVGSSWRVEHWLKPFDQIIRAYGGQPINDTSTKPTGLVYYSGLQFPLTHPASAKFAAVNESKLQFFTDAVFISNQEDLAHWMVDPRYTGNIPLINLSPSSTEIEQKISINSRGLLKYHLLEFSGDQLSFDTVVNQDGWLMYSDMWHPEWHATVNGQPVKVLKTNLAYKIIPVKKGRNVINFNFGSWPIHFAYRFLSLLSLLGILGLFFIIRRVYVGSKAI